MAQCLTCLETLAAFKFEFPCKNPDIRKKQLKQFLFAYHFNNLQSSNPLWNKFASSQIGEFVVKCEPEVLTKGLMLN